MSEFVPIIPEGMEDYYNEYKFAPATRCGDIVTVSGQIGFGKDGTIPTDVSSQIANAFAAIDSILQAAGGSLAHIYAINSYHVGDCHEHFELMIVEKSKILSEPHPAWTAISVAGLALPDAKVEIGVSACIPERK